MPQSLMRGCDAVITQKEDKMNKSVDSLGSKCEIVAYYIKVDLIQSLCEVISGEKSIKVCCL